ncbi:MAG: carboxypeptidase-like regulatory domain-containing protein [Chitinophagaceae bacterium]|nr:carboxypeptidase-like regulatory domain-containing protein [Chitinophagaceae bacterium]
MNKYKLLLTVVLISLSIHLQAQNSLNATIDGKLSNEMFKPLSGIAVRLQEAVNDVIIDSVFAKPDGTFKFSITKPGLYQLIFRQEDGLLDSSYIFSIGQLYPLHNKKLLLSFVFFNTGNTGKLKSQRRQFGGTYNDWFTSVPANLLIGLIAEYERTGTGQSNIISGTTLNNSSRGISETTVSLFNATSYKEIAVTASDEKGNYFFNEVPSGVYYLVFAKNGKENKGGLFEVKSGWQVVLKDMFRSL